MQHPNSYMFPKMIFVNVLALILITFEERAPAYTAAVQPDTTKQTQVAEVRPQPAPAADTSDIHTVAAPHKKATFKQAVLHTHKSKHRDPHLIRVRATPVNCCFRGNL